MTLLQATNQVGWSDDKPIVEVQQMWELIVAETIKLFEANQLKDRHEHDNYITVAATEKGLKARDHDIAIAEKGLTDNDSSDQIRHGLG